MAFHKVASRYAKSLLDLAKEQGNVAGVYEDIKTFMQAAQNREFYLFLKSPVIKDLSGIVSGKNSRSDIQVYATLDPKRSRIFVAKYWYRIC